MNWPTLLTVLVAVAFAFLLYRMLKPGARDRLEPFARVPLDDELPSKDLKSDEPPESDGGTR